jgi:hypothetical protein
MFRRPEECLCDIELFEFVLHMPESQRDPGVGSEMGAVVGNREDRLRASLTEHCDNCCNTGLHLCRGVFRAIARRTDDLNGYCAAHGIAERGAVSNVGNSNLATDRVEILRDFGVSYNGSDLRAPAAQFADSASSDVARRS